MARSKPTPAYRYTLPQAYQRWLYQDYAYLWTQQLEATKRQYAATGGRFHLTGFQYWMKYNLANLPDIAGMWHLDKISNGSVIDFSKNANHGTVYGPSLVNGVIDKALLFDGLDDRVDCGIDPSLHPSSFTIEAFNNISTLADWSTIVCVAFDGVNHGVILDVMLPGYLYLRIYDGAAGVSISSTPIVVSIDACHHVAATLDGLNMELLLDGLSVGTNTLANPVAYAPTRPFLLGKQGPYGFYYHGLIDEVIFYNRPLDMTLIKRHSERRYPP